MDPDEKDLNHHRRTTSSPATDPTGGGCNPNPNLNEVPLSANPNPHERANGQSPSSRNPNSPEATVSPTIEAVSKYSDASMKVFLRIRPFVVSPTKGKSVRPSNDKIAWPKSKGGRVEKVRTEKKKTSCVQVCDCHSVTISPPSSLSRMKSEVYRGFSQVFSANSSQEEVYEKIVSPIVEEFLGGKSGLLAALGPSGSGKTHTVFGSAREPGLVPRALLHIFRPSVGNQDRPKSSFYLSMFEIYVDNGKEKLSDLSPDGGDVQLQQSSLKGLKEILITDYMQAESLIARGMLRRAIAMTNSNSQSSRSQCIISIRCALDNIDGKAESQVNESVLTFVDLAGAEREKKTGNQGDRLLQSNFINKTSMVFGLCLRSLLEHQKSPKKPLRKHFQSSLLTRYLRDYLEGKKRMALILTVRPAEEDYLDTSFLLRQASPYMEIKFLNKVETSQSKRQYETIFNAVPEQSKRMKTSCPTDSMDKPEVSAHPSDTCEGLNEGYPTKVSAKSGKVPVSEINDEITCKTICADSAKERDYKILLGVAKSIWNLLKEHNQKIKVLEKRNVDLEKELCDLKNCYASQKEASVELATLVEDTNSETTRSLEKEFVGHKSAGSEGEIDVSKDIEKQADMCKTGTEPVHYPDDHLSAFQEAKQNEMVGEVEDCQQTCTKELKTEHICKTESESPQDNCQGSQDFEGNMNNEDSCQGHDLEKEDNKKTCSDKILTDVSKEIEKQADISKTGFDCLEEQRSTSLRCKGDMEMESKSYSSEPVRLPEDHISDFCEAKEHKMEVKVEDCRSTNTEKLEKKVHICKTECELPQDDCQGSKIFEGNVNNEDSYQGCDMKKDDDKETCSDKNLTEDTEKLVKKAHVSKTKSEDARDECQGSQNIERRDLEKDDNKETCSGKNLTDVKDLEKKSHICKIKSEHPKDECQGSQNFEGNGNDKDSYQGHDREKEDNKETCSDKNLTEDTKELEKKAYICKIKSEHPQNECLGSQNFEGNVKNEDCFHGSEMEKEGNKKTCSDQNLTAPCDKILKSSSDQTHTTASKRGGQGANKKGKQKKNINCDRGENFSSASKPKKSLIPQEKTPVKTKPKRRIMPYSSAATLRHDGVEFRDEERAVGGRSGRRSADVNRSTSSSASIPNWLRADVHC